MRAVLMTATGGPGVLELAEVPDADITAGHDVLVRLRAADVNPVDTKLRAHGLISGALPAVLGWDGGGGGSHRERGDPGAPG
jgi:NADPH2:quinone reductase